MIVGGIIAILIISSNPSAYAETVTVKGPAPVLQIVNVFLCRDTRRSIFSTEILGNPLIWGGVIVEIALVALIGYTPLGNFIFGTAPISAKAWLFILPFAAAMLTAEELRK